MAPAPEDALFSAAENALLCSPWDTGLMAFPPGLGWMAGWLSE